MNPIIITVISLSIIFLATTLGSFLVFFFKKNFSNKVSSIILGFASGIMLAAGLFGLLVPSLEEANKLYKEYAPFPVVIGFLLGGLILFALDKIVPHIHQDTHEEEGKEIRKVPTHLKFFLAVTLHNIPEGLAVGFACGLAIKLNTQEAMLSALSLAIGIAIQNFPEGAAVSIPLLDEGLNKSKSFVYGMLSGIVEPLVGIIAVFIASSLEMLLPWLLAFGGGAMIYVTIDELIPSMRESGHQHLGLWMLMLGFAIMMVLEMVL